MSNPHIKLDYAKLVVNSRYSLRHPFSESLFKNHCFQMEKPSPSSRIYPIYFPQCAYSTKMIRSIPRLIYIYALSPHHLQDEWQMIKHPTTTSRRNVLGTWHWLLSSLFQCKRSCFTCPVEESRSSALVLYSFYCSRHLEIWQVLMKVFIIS